MRSANERGRGCGSRVELHDGGGRGCGRRAAARAARQVLTQAQVLLVEADAGEDGGDAALDGVADGAV